MHAKRRNIVLVVDINEEEKEHDHAKIKMSKKLWKKKNQIIPRLIHQMNFV